MAKRSAPQRSTPTFALNGTILSASPNDSGLMVADFLRTRCGLPGTKIVCAEGDCGACTVLIQNPKHHQHFIPINSCIYRVAQLDGCLVISVEALAHSQDLSLVQKSLRESHASQCGYCTPGFVMATAGLVEKLKAMKCSTPISEQTAKNALTGNLCRCTGYAPIVQGVCSINVNSCESLEERYGSSGLKRELARATKSPLFIKEENFEFFAPKELKAAVLHKKKNKDARILSAGTDLGVAYNKGKTTQASWLTLHAIDKLYELKKVKNRVSVGANVSLSTLREFCKERVPELTRYLDRFASPQIKNVATLVGNVANASPIAECPPFLLVLDGRVNAISSKGYRTIPIEKFFLAYRKTALRADELISSIDFEIPSQDDHFSLTKISQRMDLDISTVNSAIRICVDGKTQRIAKARVALGGVAATPLRLHSLEEKLVGQVWSSSLRDMALQTLRSEIQPISDLRSSSAFRHIVTENVIRSFFEERTTP